MIYTKWEHCIQLCMNMKTVIEWISKTFLPIYMAKIGSRHRIIGKVLRNRIVILNGWLWRRIGVMIKFFRLRLTSNLLNRLIRKLMLITSLFSRFVKTESKGVKKSPSKECNRRWITSISNILPKSVTPI